MSNQLRRSSKGDKAPAVRVTQFNDAMRQMDQKIYQLHNALVENMYFSRYASSNLANFIKFLTQKGVVVEEEYKQFVEEQNKLAKLADEIRLDEKLSRDEKIAKALANEIPQEWVVEPEPSKEEATEEVAA